MAYDRIEPIGPEPFDRIARIQRVHRKSPDEEERDREEKRREQQEERERARAGQATRKPPEDDDGHPHVDVRA